MTAVPILTYHAARIDGNNYATNDHVAFAEDLRLVSALGLRIISLGSVADHIIEGRALPDRAVAFSFDDGTDFDYIDLPHPSHGMQRSMLNIIQDFVQVFGADRQPDLHVTSFVIASPSARGEIDQGSLIGQDWIKETWWGPATRTGRMGIGNHSWDHNHIQVSGGLPQDKLGTFHSINTRALADRQLKQAADYIRARTEDCCSSLLAYPFGEYSDFLTQEYLPLGEAVTGIRAAFTTAARHATAAESRWSIPRYTFGVDWHTPEELLRILNPHTITTQQKDA